MIGMWRVVVVLTVILFCGCLAPQNTQMVGVDMRSWNSAKSIPYENSDTTSLRNINIALRYNENLKMATLPLKISVTAPDSCRFEEIIELPLQHPATALAVATTESRPYRSGVQLSQCGSYHFTFEPQVEIRGMEAIGVEIKN